MARHHRSYSNLYAGGSRGIVVQTARKKAAQAQADRKANPEMSECTRCGRYYKNPENMHYIDFKNKIRCFEK